MDRPVSCMWYQLTDLDPHTFVWNPPFVLDAKETMPDKPEPSNTLSLSAHLDNELLKHWNQNTMTKEWVNKMFATHYSLAKIGLNII